MVRKIRYEYLEISEPERIFSSSGKQASERESKHTPSNNSLQKPYAKPVRKF